MMGSQTGYIYFLLEKTSVRKVGKSILTGLPSLKRERIHILEDENLNRGFLPK